MNYNYPILYLAIVFFLAASIACNQATIANKLSSDQITSQNDFKVLETYVKLKDDAFQYTLVDEIK